MINNYLEQQIKQNLSYKPTFEQEILIEELSEFLLARQNDGIFMLRGFAGTGKTSMVAAVVRTLSDLKQKVVLMAPTGRAAKVFTSYSGQPAFTIHKKIYRQQHYALENSSFLLNDNLYKHTLFVVDESSMISNGSSSGTSFGTGCLLDDLVKYVYSGEGCRLLLIGDTAQLPPIGDDVSPALDVDVMKGYGLDVSVADLKRVVRQSSQSGILWNATRLRELLECGQDGKTFHLKLTGFADIKAVPGEELIDALSSCYDSDGIDETLIVCRSNKRANIFNNGVRAQILCYEDELNTGDRLMIAKNSYYWTASDPSAGFLANGETAVVRRVRHSQEIYGFHFVDVTVSLPDRGDLELDIKILLDTLHAESPSMSRTDNERLWNAVMEDYADIPLKPDRLRKMKEDAFYNAVQVKYAYAVTCHKAQGGQWMNVFVDQAYLAPEMQTPEYLRWLYTAFTRATQTLYLVNYPTVETGRE